MPCVAIAGAKRPPVEAGDIVMQSAIQVETIAFPLWDGDWPGALLVGKAHATL